MPRKITKKLNNETKIRFAGFIFPTTTPVPDQVFNELLPVLNGAELKALLYICRRTFGFKKESDRISLDQMVNGIRTKKGKVLDTGTGLSKASVARALKSLAEMKVIVRQRNSSRRKGDEPTTYALNIVDSVSQNETRGVSTMRQEVSHEQDTQQTTKQQTDIQQRQAQITNLLGRGIDKVTVERLIGNHTGAYIAHKLDYLAYLQAEKPDKLASPRGWLLKAIEDDYGPPAGYQAWVTQKRKATARANKAEKTRRFSEKLVEQQNQQVEKRREEEQAALATLQGQYGATAEELAVWEDILAELKEATNGMAYAVAKSVHLVAIQDEKAIFASNNSFSIDRIREEKVGSLLVEMFQQRGYDIQEMVAVSLDGSGL